MRVINGTGGTAGECTTTTGPDVQAGRLVEDVPGDGLVVGPDGAGAAEVDGTDGAADGVGPGAAGSTSGSPAHPATSVTEIVKAIRTRREILTMTTPPRVSGCRPAGRAGGSRIRCGKGCHVLLVPQPVDRPGGEFRDQLSFGGGRRGTPENVRLQAGVEGRRVAARFR
jgi:hypothetical protein